MIEVMKLSRCPARVHDLGEISVVQVAGAWREMGREYGEAMKDRIGRAWTDVIERHILSEQFNRETADRIADARFANMPRRFREYIIGMSETSGLDLSQHVILTSAEALASSSSGIRPRASAIAVWGEYAASALIYGHSYDMLPWYRDLARLTTITMLRPSDGSLAVAVIGSPGSIISAIYMNERGVFMAHNDGEPSGGALEYHSRIPTHASALGFMLDAEDLDRLESFFLTTRASTAAIVGCADDLTARCYEWPVFDVKRRMSVRRPGLMVATDHFTEPTWGLPRPDDKRFSMTRTRRQNLLNLAEHFKGSIDLPRMKQIMDTRIDELGATSEDTAMQVIAVPGAMTVSVRVPDVVDWRDIELGELFLSR